MYGVYIEKQLHQLLISASGNYCLYEVTPQNLRIVHGTPTPEMEKTLSCFDTVITHQPVSTDVPIR